jgi:hypothetical protein
MGRRFGYRVALMGVLLAGFPGWGQTPTGSGTAQNTIQQAQAAFSAGKPVNTVTLTGNATWHAGSLEDAGPITLEAWASGAATTTMQLASTGTRIESQTAFGPAMACTWSRSDGVQHIIPAESCWKSLVWFLPDVSFQPGLLPGVLGMSDLGSDSYAGNPTRHLQGQLVFTNLPIDFVQRVMPDTTADLMLDPSSFLPEGMTYTVHPIDGTLADIPVDVRFADYRKVNGVEIPFSIQRYFNGTLQLDISISTAAAN